VQEPMWDHIVQFGLPVGRSLKEYLSIIAASIKSMFLKILLGVTRFTLVASLLLYLICLIIFLKEPFFWNRAKLIKLNPNEIRKIIGPATYDMSAKQYFVWENVNGRKINILQINSKQEEFDQNNLNYSMTEKNLYLINDVKLFEKIISQTPGGTERKFITLWPMGTFEY
jgi:hypothetical protein